ncbi:hypothetical protein F4679DRAFT_560678 [Xylaria curta]|nr:hypothetical protein F4679DRAFT_560678 [Xylaria curta]
MHFQQAATREFLEMRDLHSLPTVQEQSQSPSFGFVLVAVLLSMPIFQIAAESAGLPPVWATGLSLLVGLSVLTVRSAR